MQNYKEKEKRQGRLTH